MAKVMRVLKIRSDVYNDTSATFYLRGFDRDLKVQFKAYCARRELSMTRAIVEFMKECVRKDNKLTKED